MEDLDTLLANASSDVEAGALIGRFLAERIAGLKSDVTLLAKALEAGLTANQRKAEQDLEQAILMVGNKLTANTAPPRQFAVVHADGTETVVVVNRREDGSLAFHASHEEHGTFEGVA